MTSPLISLQSPKKCPCQTIPPREKQVSSLKIVHDTLGFFIWLAMELTVHHILSKAADAKAQKVATSDASSKAAKVFKTKSKSHLSPPFTNTHFQIKLIHRLCSTHTLISQLAGAKADAASKAGKASEPSAKGETKPAKSSSTKEEKGESTKGASKGMSYRW